MIKLKHILNEVEKDKCPPATQDIKLNLTNRQKAINEYGYGPLNPNEPNKKFWKEKMDMWKLDSPEEAKKSLCGNCAAFDVSDKMWACIEAGIKGNERAADAMASIHRADLGYCNFHHFKCAGSRSCTSWITGGAIDNKDRTQ